MYRRHDRQVLLMAVVVLAATGLAAGRLPGGTAISDLAATVLAPVQRPITMTARRVTGAVKDVRQLGQLRASQAALEAQNAELVTQNAKMVDLIRENRALRSELAFARERVDLDLVGSSLIGNKLAEEPGNVRHSIKIDVGHDDGVELWMPVANHLGLIGQVVGTAPHSSDVMLITDPASRVQGRIARSRRTGIVTGSPSGELVLRYIEQQRGDGDPVVQVGDLVYSSGLTQRFPPMLLIGQVTEVRQSDEQTHQEAVVRPAVSFSTLEVALVIRDWIPPSALGDGAGGEAPGGE